MRLVIATLLARCCLLRSSLWWRLLVHRLLLSVAWRRSVLAWLTGLLRWVLAWLLLTSMRKRLTVRAVELRVWRWLLPTVDRMRRNERLRLRAHRSEHTFLGESLAVRAAAVLALIEARAPDLSRRQQCLATQTAFVASRRATKSNDNA